MIFKSVGIITKMSKNFGAVLQAFALKTAVEKLGCEARIINYNGAIGNETYQVLKKIDSIQDIKTNILSIKHYNEIKRGSFKFQSFRDRYFSLTDPYICLDDFRKNPPRFDTYIVGSDQVWNPSILFSPVYFLDFGEKNAKKISYAASFGNNYLDSNYFNPISTLLLNLDDISIREKSGIPILHELGYNGKVVLDPTLLLNVQEWRTIEIEYSRLVGHKYILCYFLHVNQEIIHTVEYIKKETGLDVVNIATNVRLPRFGDTILWDVGPEEFVWLIDNAEIVLTSSFHGTVFSFLFQKKFVSFRINCKDSRLYDLLNDLAILDRLVDYPYTDIRINNNPCFINAIDNHNKRKEESLRFLADNLTV